MPNKQQSSGEGMRWDGQDDATEEKQGSVASPHIYDFIYLPFSAPTRASFQHLFEFDQNCLPPQQGNGRSQGELDNVLLLDTWATANGLHLL